MRQKIRVKTVKGKTKLDYAEDAADAIQRAVKLINGAYINGLDIGSVMDTAARDIMRAFQAATTAGAFTEYKIHVGYLPYSLSGEAHTEEGYTEFSISGSGVLVYQDHVV